ncbi:mitochondrial import receptor subunit TOM5 homolog isoform X5 [Latimeria chalumnae]|uniref:mitochondrial import receptor subunit TOM5 homolog isoform X5 n=1 Tax=Latimeria chalumnae TaxID=7897 RepID=UPI00313BDEB8
MSAESGGLPLGQAVLEDSPAAAGKDWGEEMEGETNEFKGIEVLEWPSLDTASGETRGEAKENKEPDIVKDPKANETRLNNRSDVIRAKEEWSFGTSFWSFGEDSHDGGGPAKGGRGTSGIPRVRKHDVLQVEPQKKKIKQRGGEESPRKKKKKQRGGAPEKKSREGEEESPRKITPNFNKLIK